MANNARKKKIGRPTIYSERLAARICAELAMGRSLRTVCKANDMPGLETVFRWLREKPDFREQYAQGKSESADALVDEMIDIADDTTGDFVEDDEGNVKFNSEHVQRSRLRVDTRKWIASKLKPKRYGERLDMNHGVQPDNPLAALVRQIQGNSMPIRQSACGGDEPEDV
jgi:hypothetical protein